MADVDINDLASIGQVNDVKPYMLPPEAWTLALNMRYRDGSPESLLGWEQIFGTPNIAPHFHMPVVTPSTDYWLYASLTNISVFDGSTHADITRAVGGNYAAGETRNWNGTILGGIPIFNNGIDVPQFRANMTAGTRFADLTNWPATLRAKVIRAFGPYLMAFHLTDGGTVKPHTVRTSHPADPGSVPSSWDPTDATKDVTVKDFPDVNSGMIVDALPLGNAMYVYKNNSTWRATIIGGRYIFDWKTVYETQGILAPRCVALTGDGTRHCVVTQDDIITHRGGTDPVSILEDRQRSSLFAEMDSANFVNSFLFSNPLTKEMWLCYPTQGSTHPNKALIWNYAKNQKGAISFADGITFRNAAVGDIEGASSELWSEGTDVWDDDTGRWSDFTRRRVVLAGTDATKFYNLDRGSTRDGTSFVQTLQREGLSIIGRKRNGEWIVDHQVIKLFQRLWPKVTGNSINIRVGAQQVVDGPISWGNIVVFDPLTQKTADFEPVSGAALAVEFSSTSKSWRIDGYKVEVAQLGRF